MNSKVILIALTTLLYSLTFVSAASPHKHEKHTSKERLKDGVYVPRDSHHNEGEEHHVEFDHEAILGSVKEAEEFDTLSDEEAKRRLGVIAIKMDLNKDGYVDRHELKAWIIRSFKKLSEEEANEHFDEVDADNNDLVTWNEYITYVFNADNETSISEEEKKMFQHDKLMFFGADLNKDGQLSREEYLLFNSPEESPEMLPLVLEDTLSERDVTKDNKIDFTEYVGEEARDHDKEWLLEEKTRFEEYDKNKDGFLTGDEILSWAVPNNEETAVEEVDHLFASADDDHDNRLSYKEIIDNHETFVGSEATEYGDQLESMEHDEL